jgi:hypothetical protein
LQQESFAKDVSRAKDDVAARFSAAGLLTAINPRRNIGRGRRGERPP